MWVALMNHADSKKESKEWASRVKDAERKSRDERERFNSLTIKEKEKEYKANLRKKKDKCFYLKIKDLEEIIESIKEGERAHLCLPTPGNANGSCDTSLVESYIKRYEPDFWRVRGKDILLKSTVDHKYGGAIEIAKDIYGKEVYAQLFPDPDTDEHCDHSRSYKKLNEIDKYIKDGVNNLINKEFRKVVESRRDTLNSNIKGIDTLREGFLKYSDKPKGKRQKDVFNVLTIDFNSTVSQTVKARLLKKLSEYFKEKAADYDIRIIYFSRLLNLKDNGDKERLNAFKSDLLKNNEVNRRFYFVKIKSNIDDKNYLQIGTTLKEDLSLLSNDVVDVVEIYKDVEIESNIALALQYQLLRKYRPDNYIAEDEFSEFERFDGYTEIVPMKYKTEVCKDIENVVDNYEDVKFVFKNLVLLNDLNS